MSAALVSAVEKARELLANPDRVVLDPEHYFERDLTTGETVECDVMDARLRRDSCRVCFCGAATLAAIEATGDYVDATDLDDEVRSVLAAKAVNLGVEPDREIMARFVPFDGYDYANDPVIILTSALIAGRAVEVCDAVIADLKAEALG